jgi:hypothetical protein
MRFYSLLTKYAVPVLAIAALLGHGKLHIEGFSRGA